MKRIIVSGLLVLYCVIAGLGWFLRPNPTNLLLFSWLTGYLILAFSTGYSAYLSKTPFDSFPFIVLGIILMNFFVQTTGGVHSFLWPAYFPVAAVIAILSPLWRTLSATALILAIEAANLFLSGQADPDKTLLYAGSALSLVIVPAVISRSIRRTRGEKEQVKQELEKLIEHADAIDPLAQGDTIDALNEKNQLASNVKAARNREEAFDGLLEMIYGFVPAHTYALFLKERIGAKKPSSSGRAGATPTPGFWRPSAKSSGRTRTTGSLAGCTKYTQPQCLSNMDHAGGTLGLLHEDHACQIHSCHSHRAEQ